MNTLLLLVEAGSAWSPEAWAIEQGGKRRHDGRHMVERDSTWLSVVKDDRVLDDFDAEERLQLRSLVTDPTIYLIEWKGPSLVEDMLRSIPRETRAAIDNDHGLLVPVQKILYEPIDRWAKIGGL